nr:MAG: hypothetical protein [Bacteriophage sp.]
MYLSILFFSFSVAKVRIISEIKEYKSDEKIKIPRKGDRMMLSRAKKRVCHELMTHPQSLSYILL